MSTKSAFTKNPTLRFLISSLPGRMRRLVFLASLAGVARETKVYDETLIKKLNTILQLSTTSAEALRLPIHVSSVIWSNKSAFAEEIKTLVACRTVDATALTCATTIANASPTWLVGDNLSLVIKDILDLFTKDGSPFLRTQVVA